MSIYKHTDLGRIRISDVLFAQIIINGLKQKECLGKAWPATAKGKIVGSEQKYNVSEVAQYISVKQGEDGQVKELECNIIVQFGASINGVTTALADYIAEKLCEEFGFRPERIKITVTGIKSKLIARRNIEVIKEYES